MTKLSVADSSGAYQTAAGLWVADPTGPDLGVLVDQAFAQLASGFAPARAG